LKAKEAQIRELESKTEVLMRSTRNIEEESQYQTTSIKQELGRAQITLHELNMAKHKVEVEKEQVVRDQHEFMIRFDILKKDYELVAKQKEATIRDIEAISHDKEMLLEEREALLKERERIGYENEKIKEALTAAENRLKETSMQKSRELENTIRTFE
jgi:hypothetical protein